MGIKPRPTVVIYPDGRIEEYESRFAVCRALGISTNRLRSALQLDGSPISKGKRKGFIFLRGEKKK